MTTSTVSLTSQTFTTKTRVLSTANPTSSQRAKTAPVPTIGRIDSDSSTNAGKQNNRSKGAVAAVVVASTVLLLAVLIFVYRLRGSQPTQLEDENGQPNKDILFYTAAPSFGDEYEEIDVSGGKSRCTPPEVEAIAALPEPLMETSLNTCVQLDRASTPSFYGKLSQSLEVNVNNSVVGAYASLSRETTMESNQYALLANNGGGAEYVLGDSAQSFYDSTTKCAAAPSDYRTPALPPDNA